MTWTKRVQKHVLGRRRSEKTAHGAELDAILWRRMWAREMVPFAEMRTHKLPHKPHTLHQAISNADKMASHSIKRTRSTRISVEFASVSIARGGFERARSVHWVAHVRTPRLSLSSFAP
eukprot:6174343-Pleurochrysis_carterae.AAC.2